MMYWRKKTKTKWNVTRGIKWIGTPAGVTPTNAELADGSNWQLAEDRKNVAITKLIARVD